MKKFYEENSSLLLSAMEVSSECGLTEEQVLQLQKEKGKNLFAQPKKVGLFRKILHQLKDVSIIVLLVAVGLSLVLAIVENSGLLEPFAILAVVVLNVILAITQEGKAEKALDALAEMNTPTCIVLRDGIRKNIDTAELVPGDIVILETGNVIPADARILESTGLFCDEAALTGESEASEKDAEAILDGMVPLGDQKNMVFSGCIVTAGHGVALIVATGMDTQMGQVAAHLYDHKIVKTPLQVRLDKLGKMISWIAIAAALFLMALGLRGGTNFGIMVMTAISLAVAAVPETLSLIVTLSLTNGVQRMVKNHALIRRLPAVETLGNTSVICSDKTGTLTQNRMTITRLWQPGSDAFSAEESFSEAQTRFVKKLAMASNASIEQDAEGKLHFIGNATEVAIMRLAEEKGCNEPDFTKVSEIPFSSERKRMTVVIEDPAGGYMVLTKGALDRLPLGETDENTMAAITGAHDAFAEKALRVLALAYKHIDSLPGADQPEALECDMTLIGLIGLIDPPRPEVAHAIQTAKKAGICTVMITGDHAVTAKAIANELGILTEGKKVLTGAELAEISDQELQDTVRSYAVYARVSPEDKIRIVRAWKANGEIVAMTGDGVNDAPALKAADVGIAMGQTGTEVAKNASDMILTDDNFATIVEAVNEGRNVYENIKKTISFLLVCNFSEIVIMLLAQVAGWGIMLTPLMLLLINLLGDGIPGLQLAKEISDENLMNRKPIKRDESFFSSDVLRILLRQTAACSVVALGAFCIGAFATISHAAAPSAEIGQTMAFLTVGWTSIFHIFHVRTKKSVFKSRIFSNRPLTVSALVMMAVFGILAATPLGIVLELASLDLIHWGIVAVLSMLPTFVRELGRLLDYSPHRARYTRTVKKFLRKLPWRKNAN